MKRLLNFIFKVLISFGISIFAIGAFYYDKERQLELSTIGFYTFLFTYIILSLNISPDKEDLEAIIYHIHHNNNLKTQLTEVSILLSKKEVNERYLNKIYSENLTRLEKLRKRIEKDNFAKKKNVNSDAISKDNKKKMEDLREENDIIRKDLVEIEKHIKRLKIEKKNIEKKIEVNDIKKGLLKKKTEKIIKV